MSECLCRGITACVQSSESKVTSLIYTQPSILSIHTVIYAVYVQPSMLSIYSHLCCLCTAIYAVYIQPSMYSHLYCLHTAIYVQPSICCLYTAICTAYGTTVAIATVQCRYNPIRAHVAVATQRMPWGLSNTDYRIWANISHVGLCMGNTMGAYTRYIIYIYIYI